MTETTEAMLLTPRPANAVVRTGTALLLAVAGVVLAWLVTTKTLVAYLSSEAPGIAARIDPNDPTLLVQHVASVVDRLQDSSGSPAPARSASEVAQLRAELIQSIEHDPLDARAYRLLGQLAIEAGVATSAGAGAGAGPGAGPVAGPDAQSAIQTFMETAARQSLREPTAVYWLMREGLARHDYPQAIARADVLLSTYSHLTKLAVPVLSAAAEDKQGVAPLIELLKSNPPWRQRFFQRLTETITDARTPLVLLLALQKSSAPPTLAESRPYLDFLLSRKYYELAYSTWLQLLPPEALTKAGLLFNGSFEDAPFKPPFDWDVAGGSGVSAAIVRRSDKPDQHGLLVEFGIGRVQFGGVHQILMLTPGRYRLSGQMKGDISGRRGLVWRVACLGNDSAAIGSSPMLVGMVPSWRRFEASITVPEKDCRAQHLMLLHDSRSASEQLVNGSMWFDDLQIDRVEEPVATAK